MPEAPGPRDQGRFFLAIPADLAELSKARLLMEEVGRAAHLPGDRVFDLQVAVSEACANAIEHAASDVEVEAWLLADRVIVEITNDGAFQPGLYKDDSHRRRGLGLPLMVSLADQVRVSRLASGKTQVSLTFFLVSASQREASGLSLRAGSARQASSGEKGAQPVGRWVWPAIPLLVVAVLVLYALGVNSSHESPTLLASFNTLFLTAALLIMAFLAGRSYLLGGSRALWPLGWGAAILGLSYLLGGLLITRPNEAVTISNVGIFAAGVCMALSGYWALIERPREVKPSPEMWTILGPYLGVAVFTGSLVAAAFTGVIPHFFIKGQGYSWWRNVVLGLGVLELLSGSICFRILYRRQPSRFLLWCFSGLALIGVALGANLLTGATPGTPLAWLTRAGGWLGGIVLLVAVFAVEPGGSTWFLPLQRALRETENRYKNLVDLSPDAVLVDAGGKYIFANAASARLLGVDSPVELVGKDALEYVHPDDRGLASQRMGQVLAGGVTPPRQIRMLRLDGTSVSVEVTGSRVEFDGRPASQIVIRELIERKRAEQAEEEQRLLLVTAQKDYHVLFNGMLDGLAVHEIILDTRGEPCDYRFLAANPAFERLTGLHATDIIGRTVLEVIPDLEFSWIERYGRVALTGEEAHFESQAAGLGRHYEVSAYCPEKGRFATIFHDITERKRAEEALKVSEEGLKRSQEIAHLGSWELDLVRDKLTWSDEVYRIFGLEPQEFGATYEAFLGHVHPDDRTAVDEAYSGSLREGRDSYEIEHRVLRRPTGEIRWVSEKCAHVRGADGCVVRSVGMVLDISERKRAEEELRLKEEEARHLIRHAPAAVYEIDFRGPRFLSVNDVMCEQSGYSREESLPWTPWTLWMGKVAPALARGSRRCSLARPRQTSSSTRSRPRTTVRYGPS